VDRSGSKPRQVSRNAKSFALKWSEALWNDSRVMVAPFNGEKTLIPDTVPVELDSLWLAGMGCKNFALGVEDNHSAIAWAAHTVLRETVGMIELEDILVGRAKMDAEP